jgi:hypothetical protein
MMRRLWAVLAGRWRKPPALALPPDKIAGMVAMVAMTRPDEIDCNECFEQLDRFAELHLSGKDPAEAMPLVQDHLERCGDCREEFEALLAALAAAAPGAPEEGAP